MCISGFTFPFTYNTRIKDTCQVMERRRSGFRQKPNYLAYYVTTEKTRQSQNINIHSSRNIHCWSEEMHRIASRSLNDVTCHHDVEMQCNTI